MEVSVYDEFTKNFIVKPDTKSRVGLNILLHISTTNVDEFNSYAQYALDNDNDTKKRSIDEATSIHIITSKLNTKLHILYESQICGFHGKPDFIIRLGKNLYIMVSTTQAITKRYDFTQIDANRLVSKKIKGLYMCSQNLECLVDEVLDIKYVIRPILHILAPNIENAQMCKLSYSKIITDIKYKNIKVVITVLKNHQSLLKSARNIVFNGGSITFNKIYL
jgi:hypothetical protein